MNTRTGRLVLGLLAFVLLFLITVAVSVPKIENDLTSDVEQQLSAAGITGVAVSFTGRDGTMTGPAVLRDPSLAAVTDRSGIRSLEYASIEAVVVSPTTSEAPPTTVEVTTTVAETTTTVAPTTTAATTTVPPTTAPAVQVDATATVAGQTITLSGAVASDAQAQVLRDAATVAFGLQGTIEDQLSVDAQTAPPEIDQAVNGLAAFINGAGPALFDGSGQLQNRALDVTGEAFSAAAAASFGQALAAAGSQYGVTVNGTVGPGPSAPGDLQPSLTALAGRSGINFGAGSAELDARSQVVLDSAAETIKQVPGVPVQIVGYTDSDGAPDANLALSQSRADAVKAYLVERGVAEGDLTALGRGEADPIAGNDTPENKAKNRRIEFIVQGS